MYGRGAPEPYGIIASNQPPTCRKLARLLSRPPRFPHQPPKNAPNRQTITPPGRIATPVIRLVQTAERTTDSTEQWAWSVQAAGRLRCAMRSEEHTSELQSLMRISYAVFCLKKNTQTNH